MEKYLLILHFSPSWLQFLILSTYPQQLSKWLKALFKIDMYCWEHQANISWISQGKMKMTAW